MTQPSTTQTATRPRFRVYGKDRLLDPWTSFEADFKWQALAWAAERSWTRYDLNGNVLVDEFTPAAMIRLEKLVNGEWIADSAWESPDRRDALNTWIRRWAGANSYRIAEESPAA